MKKIIKRFLRIFGLLHTADRMRYLGMKWKNRRTNRSFRRKYPDVILPPDYMMYEAFQLDYTRYYFNGKQTAKWLIELVKPYYPNDLQAVLDWGCGPARIIRHFPELAPEATSLNATDYNEGTIQWCQKHLPGIQFSQNELMPPLKYEDDQFDLVYGISIFTHLSENAHQEWLEELFRILRPGGILFLTLHGSAFMDKLEPQEQLKFDANQLIVRGQVKEGHRTFIAFHPPGYVKKWTSRFKLLEHIPGGIQHGKPAQDVWILSKPELNLQKE